MKHRWGYLLLTCLLLWVSTGGVGGAAETEKTVAELMRATFRAQPTYKGMKTVIFWSKKGSEAVICRTYRQADMTRFDYLPSPRHLARIVLQTKDFIRYYQPVKKLLITEERPEDEDLNLLEISFKNYDWDIEGDAIVAGHHAKILKSVNKQTGTVAQRLWIDSRRNVILRKESYNIRGELYFASYFTEIDFPKTLDPGLFTLNMPSDTKEIIKKMPVRITNADQLQALLGFAPRWRDNLPGGYQLLTTQKEILNGHQAVRMTYSDGLDIVSLVELPSEVHQRRGGSDTHQLEVLGRNLQFENLLEGNLLQWRDSHIFYTLVGSLPQDEMLAMYDDLMSTPGLAQAAAPVPPNRGLLYYFWRGVDRISHLGRTP